MQCGGESTNANSTGPNVAGHDRSQDYIGYLAASFAVLLYGSSYVPLKRCDTQDGMAFQLFRCASIWLIGLVVNAIRNFPPMQPLVMIGGAVWATGHLCVAAIIQTIGMSLGMLIWGTLSMFAGWASGRFGWFDIPPQVPTYPLLNYFGVLLCVIASAIVFFVNPETMFTEEKKATDAENEVKQVLKRSCNSETGVISFDDELHRSLKQIRKDSIAAPQNLNNSSNGYHSDGPFWVRLSPWRRKLLGTGLAIISGPCYGLAFAPTFYVQAHVSGASLCPLDYIFSHFTGILSASFVHFLMYAAVSHSKPMMNPAVALPAFASGAMWGLAAAAWFIANQVLSEPVAFPIIATAPVVIASCWSVLVFHEIKGTRNFILLAATFTATTIGSVLNGLSH